MESVKALHSFCLVLEGASEAQIATITRLDSLSELLIPGLSGILMIT